MSDETRRRQNNQRRAEAQARFRHVQEFEALCAAGLVGEPDDDDALHWAWDPDTGELDVWYDRPPKLISRWEPPARAKLAAAGGYTRRFKATFFDGTVLNFTLSWGANALDLRWTPPHKDVRSVVIRFRGDDGTLLVPGDGTVTVALRKGRWPPVRQRPPFKPLATPWTLELELVGS